MVKKYQVRWYDAVKQWEHQADEKNDLSKAELMKEIRAIISTCENPVIAVKVWGSQQ